MTEPARELQPSGLQGTLRAALGAAALVGGIAGGIEGALAAAGIDSAHFFHRARFLGLVEALRSAERAWEGPLGLLGCVAASMLVHAALFTALLVPCGLLGHRWWRTRPVAARRRTLVALGLGAWLGAELFWWTRPIVLSGLSMAHPAKLAVLAVCLLVGSLLGWLAARAVLRAPALLRRATPFVLTAAFLGGALFLFVDTRRSSTIGALHERNRERPNVLLFIVDALRQDVLGCYGNERVETPHIDRLAREGALFENAFAQAPFTWTSFGSFLTGKYPRRHGLLKMAAGVRMAPNVTLATWLERAGRREGGSLSPEDYVTAAFMTGTVSQGSGLLQGFDHYFEAMVGHELVDVHSQWSRFRSTLLPYMVWNKLAQRFDPRIVATTASRWIEANAGRRWCALVHYYSTHTTYDPEDEFREKYVDPAYAGPIQEFRADYRQAIEEGKYELTDADREQIRNLYYGGVSMADAMIGDVLAVLEQQGILDDTVVVVTSDHGEELGDHGLWEHNFMYGTNLRIPLVVRYPRGLPAGVRVEAPVDSIDLLPTLCDLLAIEAPHDEAIGARGLVDGKSLLPLVRGEIEALRPYTFAENGLFLSIQGGGWKLVVRREVLEEGGWEKALSGAIERPQLYDLSRDPHEHANRFAEEPERAGELFSELDAWSKSLPIPEYLFERSSRDLEDERLLIEAMGYGGGVGEGMDESGTDE